MLQGAAGCRCASRQCHRSYSDSDFNVTDAVVLGAETCYRASSVDLFLVFFDLEAELAGSAAGTVAGVVASMVADVVDGVVAGAVFSDFYAVATAVCVCV